MDNPDNMLRYDHKDLSDWFDRRESPQMSLCTVQKVLYAYDDLPKEHVDYNNALSDEKARTQRENMLDRCSKRMLIKLMGYALDVDNDIMERLHPVED